MTPNETTAILRQLIDWRRDKSNWPPSPVRVEMIDINELRRLAQAATPGPDGVSLSWIRLLRDFQQGASPAAIIELLDRLEAAEKDVILKEQVIDALGLELNTVAKERDALRTKVETTENAAASGVLEIVSDMSAFKTSGAATSHSNSATPEGAQTPARRTALYKVLHQIAANPGSTTESLTAATNLPYPRVLKALAKGVELNWFERRALSNPSKRGPRFSFYLTPAGEEVSNGSHA